MNQDKIYLIWSVTVMILVQKVNLFCRLILAVPLFLRTLSRNNPNFPPPSLLPGETAFLQVGQGGTGGPRQKEGAGG